MNGEKMYYVSSLSKGEGLLFLNTGNQFLVKLNFRNLVSTTI